ncbi:MAG: hypothetical protein ACOX52_12315 [Verrucomicrobiota bacterium]|jgi:hypothetical protein
MRIDLRIALIPALASALCGATPPAPDSDRPGAAAVCFDLDPDSVWSPPENTPWFLEKTFTDPVTLNGIEVVLKTAQIAPQPTPQSAAENLTLEVLVPESDEWTQLEAQLHESLLPSGHCTIRWLTPKPEPAVGIRIRGTAGTGPAIANLTLLPEHWEEIWSGIRPGHPPAVQMQPGPPNANAFVKLDPGLSSIRTAFRLPSSPPGYLVTWRTPAWNPRPCQESVQISTEPPAPNQSATPLPRLLATHPILPAIGEFQETWFFPTPVPHLDRIILSASQSVHPALLPAIESISIPLNPPAPEASLPYIPPSSRPLIGVQQAPDWSPVWITPATSSLSVMNWPFAAALTLDAGAAQLTQAASRTDHPARLFPSLAPSRVGLGDFHRQAVLLPDGGCLLPQAATRSGAMEHTYLSILYGLPPTPAVYHCRIDRTRDAVDRESVFNFLSPTPTPAATSCRVRVAAHAWGGPNGSLLYELVASGSEPPWRLAVSNIAFTPRTGHVEGLHLPLPGPAEPAGDWLRITLPNGAPIWIHGLSVPPSAVGGQWSLHPEIDTPLTLLVPLDRTGALPQTLQPPPPDTLSSWEAPLPTAPPDPPRVAIQWSESGPRYLQHAAEAARAELLRPWDDLITPSGSTIRPVAFTPTTLIALHAIARMGNPDTALDLLNRLWQKTDWIQQNQRPPLWALGAALELVECCLELGAPRDETGFWNGFTELAAERILQHMPDPPRDSRRSRQAFNLVAARSPEAFAPMPNGGGIPSVLGDVKAIRGLAAAARILEAAGRNRSIRELQRARSEWTADLQAYLPTRLETTQSPTFLPLLKTPRIPGTRPDAAYAPLAALCLESGLPNTTLHTWDEYILNTLVAERRLWNGLLLTPEKIETGWAAGVGAYYRRNGNWTDLRHQLLALGAISMDPGAMAFIGSPNRPNGADRRRRHERGLLPQAILRTPQDWFEDLTTAALYWNALRDLLVFEERDTEGALTGQLHLFHGAPMEWWNGLQLDAIPTPFGNLSTAVSTDPTIPRTVTLTLRRPPERSFPPPLHNIRLHVPHSAWISPTTRIRGGMKGRTGDRWIEFSPTAETVQIELHTP